MIPAPGEALVPPPVPLRTHSLKRITTKNAQESAAAVDEFGGDCLEQQQHPWFQNDDVQVWETTMTPKKNINRKIVLFRTIRAFQPSPDLASTSSASSCRRSDPGLPSPQVGNRRRNFPLCWSLRPRSKTLGGRGSATRRDSEGRSW